MDILGPFPISSLGNRYLLIVTDCFTKWVEAFPLSNMGTKTIAEVFVREIICRMEFLSTFTQIKVVILTPS